MSGNTTVVLRKSECVAPGRAAEREQELRQLLFFGTIREAREYADDHGTLVVLARMAERKGTAIAELARTTLLYPAIVAELRDMVQSADSDELAASRIDKLFFRLTRKEIDFGQQRIIMETMRAWAKQPAGSREKFVSDDFFGILANRHAEAAAQAEQQR